jgi:hypothetical protein
VSGPLLGFGPAARALGPLPDPGDDGCDRCDDHAAARARACAVGGGPLLVANGSAVDDPNAPAPEERDRRFPVSGAATTAGGERCSLRSTGRPRSSIGVTRPQFAALLLAFGATMRWRSTPAARRRSSRACSATRLPSVLNSPSDGEERVVADGFFVYSDAPNGPPARFVVRPSRSSRLPRARAYRSRSRSRCGRPSRSLGERASGAAIVATGTRIARRRSAERGSSAHVRIDVVTRLAKLDISPDARDPDPRATVRFSADGVDASGRDRGARRSRSLVERSRTLRRARYLRRAGSRRARRRKCRWRTRRVDAARGASSRRPRALRCGERARLALRLRARGSARRHRVRCRRAEMTCVTISRAANAPRMRMRTSRCPASRKRSPSRSIGDASGVGVRAAFVNTFGERRALTLARAVDWSGWRAQTVALPDDLNPPVRLVSLYAVDSLANAPSHAAGRSPFVVHRSSMRGRRDGARAGVLARALRCAAGRTHRRSRAGAQTWGGVPVLMYHKVDAQVPATRSAAISRSSPPRSKRNCATCASIASPRSRPLELATRRSRAAEATRTSSSSRSTTATTTRRRPRCRSWQSTVPVERSTCRADSSERRATLVEADARDARRRAWKWRVTARSTWISRRSIARVRWPKPAAACAASRTISAAAAGRRTRIPPGNTTR